MFNMSAPFIYQLFMDSVMSIFCYINIITGNNEVSEIQLNTRINIINNFIYSLQEAKAFSDAHNWNLNCTKEIASKISTFEVDYIGERLVIITQGEKSVIVAKSKYLNKYLICILDSN